MVDRPQSPHPPADEGYFVRRKDRRKFSPHARPGVRGGRQRKPQPDPLGHGLHPTPGIRRRRNLVRRQTHPQERPVRPARAGQPESRPAGRCMTATSAVSSRAVYLKLDAVAALTIVLAVLILNQVTGINGPDYWRWKWRVHRGLIPYLLLLAAIIPLLVAQWR